MKRISPDQFAHQRRSEGDDRTCRSIDGNDGFQLHVAKPYEAARRIVSEDNTLLMTQRDFEAFTSSLENPPKPEPALRKLMARR